MCYLPVGPKKPFSRDSVRKRNGGGGRRFDLLGRTELFFLLRQANLWRKRRGDVQAGGKKGYSIHML